LWDRRPEGEALDQLLAANRVGSSRVLVVCGEAGVGKTALLDYLAGRALGCRVARVAVIRRWSWPSPVCTSCVRPC
jgi:polynucleotide 5'-kinase involved in rRNA processing